MKSFIALFALVSTAALASGPENIGGVSGRLENITCKGAYVMSMKDTDKMSSEIEKKCMQLPEAAQDSCQMEVIKKIGKSAPSATFVGQANEGTTTFQMNIFEGHKSVFSSTRVGTHGDGENSINLMFSRVGDEDFEFVIESGMLSEDGNSTPVLFVPVKRRIVSDLLYVFTEGCSLKWE